MQTRRTGSFRAPSARRRSEPLRNFVVRVFIAEGASPLRAGSTGVDFIGFADGEASTRACRVMPEVIWFARWRRRLLLRPPRRFWTSPALIALAGLVALAIIGRTEAGAIRRSRLAHQRLAQLKTMVRDAALTHPNALWRVVHDLCLRSETTVGSPAPCARVSLSGRYAVIKDPELPTQLLLVPTDRVVGVESPSLLKPGSPNYWQAAWSARDLFQRQFAQPAPREDVGMAVNSAFSRNQTQLHIHIDCVRAQTRDLVADHLDQIGARWSKLGSPLLGSRYYRVLWVPGEELGDADPFKLLARDPETRRAMAGQSVAVFGARRVNGQPGFVILSYQEGPNDANGPSGEALLDHHCHVLDKSQAGPRR